MTKEAMKLALEALEENHHLIEEHERPEYLAQYDRVISAVSKALAEQPAQQEPVAWMHTMIDDVVIGHRPADIARHPDRWTPLYTAPSPCPTCEALARTVMMDQTAHDTPPQRTWVGLTDEEWQEIDASLNGKRDLARIFTRAIEAKLKEKNNG